MDKLALCSSQVIFCMLWGAAISASQCELSFLCLFLKMLIKVNVIFVNMLGLASSAFSFLWYNCHG